MLDKLFLLLILIPLILYHLLIETSVILRFVTPRQILLRVDRSVILGESNIVRCKLDNKKLVNISFIMANKGPVSKSSNHSKIFVRSESNYYPIQIESINWVYAKGNHCTIFLTGGKEFNVRISLVSLMDYLTEDSFVQSHRNYLINYQKVEVYNPLGSVLIDNKEVPVSKNYKKMVEDKFLFLK